MITTIVSEDHAGERIDTFATHELPQISRASVQKLCERGEIVVNSQPVKTSYKLRTGDVVGIGYEHDKQRETPAIELPVIYEDADCLVINKPSGILTHSKGAFNPEATVATFINSRLSDLSGQRAGIVHRLDRATSGVIICAKHPEALSWLQKQFSLRKVKKHYHAIVRGHPEPESAIIDMPIERNPKKPQTFRTGKTGKPAVTQYKILNVGHKIVDAENSEAGNRTSDLGQPYSLLELEPLTGRTHQLRVHLKRIGYPIVGDILYGGETAERLMLHASILEITLPNRERRIFEADIPQLFKQYVQSTSNG